MVREKSSAADAPGVALDTLKVNAHDQKLHIRVSSHIDDEDGPWSSYCGLVDIQGPLEDVQKLESELRAKYQFTTRDPDRNHADKENPIIGGWPEAWMGHTLDITHGEEDHGSVRIAGTPRFERGTKQTVMEFQDDDKTPLGQLTLSVPLNKFPRMEAGTKALRGGQLTTDYYPAREAVEAALKAAEMDVREVAKGLGIKSQTGLGENARVYR